MAKNIPINVKYMDSAGKAHDTEIERDAQKLHGASLSVLEKIAPSETVLDPIPEDDDPDITHRGWQREIETGRRTGNPVWTFCGKLVYIPQCRRRLPTCPACIEATPAGSRHC